MPDVNWFHVVTQSSTIDVPAGTELLNRGVLGVAGTNQPATLTVDAAGGYENDRLMVAGRDGTFILTGTAGTNSGVMAGVAGGQFEVMSTTTNTGKLIADGGMLTIGRAVTQQGSGETSVTHNGTLDVLAPISGNEIQIQSGMLEIDNAIALLDMNSTVHFTGDTGSIKFDNAMSVTENWSDMLHSLVATVDYGYGIVATKEIAMPAGAYSAANFSLHDNTIAFTAHPTS